jgi:cytochrome P450
MSMDVESWDTMPTTIWDSVQRVITLVGVDTVLLLLALSYLAFATWPRLSRRGYCKGVPIEDSNGIFSIGGRHRGKKKHSQILENVGNQMPIYQSRVWGQTVVTVSDASLAFQVMKTTEGKGVPFHKTPMNHQNIFNLDTNDAWKARRAALKGSFASLRLFQQEYQEENIKIATEKLMDELNKAASTNTTINLDELFGKFALTVILRMGFAFQIDDEECTEILQSIKASFENADVASFPLAWWWSWWPFGTMGRFARAQTRLKQFWTKLLVSIENVDDPMTLPTLSVALLEMLARRDFTRADILAEINTVYIDFFFFPSIPTRQSSECQSSQTIEMNLRLDSPSIPKSVFSHQLVVAGHETTAHSLSFLIIALMQNPCIEAQVRERCVMSDDANRLPAYVEAVILESMRLWPVAQGSIRRVNQIHGQTLKDDQGQSYFFPQGTWIRVDRYALHASKRNWGDDAHKFDPNRWLDDGNLIKQGSFHGYCASEGRLTFMPFAYGKRSCIGTNLSLLEVSNVVSSIMPSFSFASDNVGEYIDFQLTAKPTDGLSVRVLKV